MDVAGKTGTTQSNKDLYFAGYTGHYTAAVWSGFKIPEKIVLSGSTVSPSTRLWKKVMLQIHDGLETIPLYDANNMESVTICLESGLLATEACKNDIRTSGSSGVRYETVLVYPEDAPTQFCDKHVTVEYCVSGNGVANEYCHLFHNVGVAALHEKALVKITATRLEELKKVGKNLSSIFRGDDYVYLVDEYGNPQPFYGVNGDINLGQTAPYKVCTIHTQQNWETYKQNHPWIDGGGQEPEPDPDPNPDVNPDPNPDAEPNPDGGSITPPEDNSGTTEPAASGLDRILDYLFGR